MFRVCRSRLTSICIDRFFKFYHLKELLKVSVLDVGMFRDLS